MRTVLVIGIAAAAALVPSVASAIDIPPSTNAPPTGAGTERPRPRPRDRVQEGVQIGAELGSGFSDTYGIGIAGRVGYAFRSGVYAGGRADYFGGHTINNQSAHATFLGGEIGYEFFPSRRFELRPYVFGGPAWVTTVNASATGQAIVEDKASFGLQPGVLVAYHFGDAFVQVDGRYLVTPTPTTLAVFAGGGFGF